MTSIDYQYYYYMNYFFLFNLGENYISLEGFIIGRCSLHCVVYMIKCPLEDCVSNKNNTYVGLTTTTISRRLTVHLRDSSSIPYHLKTYSVPKYEFRKILVENTTIITYEINKLRLQILEALHIKTKKKNKINKINFENRGNILKCL